ncbi:Os01g0513950, partial [Oryza sativa Japonica Group]
CRDCKIELKHLLADVTTLTETNQPGHYIGALINVSLVIGVCPEPVHKLELPLLRLQGHLPFDEEALSLFFCQP